MANTASGCCIDGYPSLMREYPKKLHSKRTAYIKTYYQSSKRDIYIYFVQLLASQQYLCTSSHAKLHFLFSYYAIRAKYDIYKGNFDAKH